MNILLFGGLLHSKKIENFNDVSELFFYYEKTDYIERIEITDDETSMFVGFYKRTKIYDKDRDIRLYIHESIGDGV